MTCISVVENVSYQQTFVFWEKCVNGCFVFRFLNEKYNAFQLPYFSFNKAVVTFAVFMSIYLRTLVWIVNVVRFLNEKYNAFQLPFFQQSRCHICGVYVNIFTHFGMNCECVADVNNFDVWNIKIIIYDVAGSCRTNQHIRTFHGVYCFHTMVLFGPEKQKHILKYNTIHYKHNYIYQPIHPTIIHSFITLFIHSSYNSFIHHTIHPFNILFIHTSY